LAIQIASRLGIEARCRHPARQSQPAHYHLERMAFVQSPPIETFEAILFAILAQTPNWHASPLLV
jgi:hypothetical protein